MKEIEDPEYGFFGHFVCEEEPLVVVPEKLPPLVDIAFEDSHVDWIESKESVHVVPSPGPGKNRIHVSKSVRVHCLPQKFVGASDVVLCLDVVFQRLHTVLSVAQMLEQSFVRHVVQDLPVVGAGERPRKVAAGELPPPSAQYCPQLVIRHNVTMAFTFYKDAVWAKRFWAGPKRFEPSSS